MLGQGAAKSPSTCTARSFIKKPERTKTWQAVLAVSNQVSGGKKHKLGLFGIDM